MSGRAVPCPVHNGFVIAQILDSREAVFFSSRFSFGGAGHEQGVPSSRKRVNQQGQSVAPQPLLRDCRSADQFAMKTGITEQQLVGLGTLVIQMQVVFPREADSAVDLHR